MDFSFLNGVDVTNLIVTFLVSGGGLAGALHYIIKLCQMYFAYKTLKGIDDCRDIHASLQNLREVEGCSHAIIFRGHDHGSIPSVGNPYFFSYSYGAAPQRKNLPEGAMRIHQINGITASHQDIVHLLDIINRKTPILINIDDVKDESFLATYFKSHKIKNVVAYYIKNINKNIFFLVVAKEGNGFKKSDIEKIYPSLDLVRATFRNKL